MKKRLSKKESERIDRMAAEHAKIVGCDGCTAAALKNGANLADMMLEPGTAEAEYARDLASRYDEVHAARAQSRATSNAYRRGWDRAFVGN